MLFYSLLASKVLNEKSVINLIENPLYKTVASLLLISKFLLFWFQQFDYSVSQCGFLSLSWLEFTELLGCAYSCLHQIWEVYFFKFFFCPFYLSGIPVIHVLVHLMVPPVSQAPFMSFFFFLLLRMDSLNCLPFKFADPYTSPCSKVSTADFSFQLFYFSILGFLFGSFLQFLSLYWDSRFVHTLFSLFIFSYLSMFSFSSVNI